MWLIFLAAKASFIQMIALRKLLLIFIKKKVKLLFNIKLDLFFTKTITLNIILIWKSEKIFV